MLLIGTLAFSCKKDWVQLVHVHLAQHGWDADLRRWRRILPNEAADFVGGRDIDGRRQGLKSNWKLGDGEIQPATCETNKLAELPNSRYNETDIHYLQNSIICVILIMTIWSKSQKAAFAGPQGRFGGWGATEAPPAPRRGRISPSGAVFGGVLRLTPPSAVWWSPCGGTFYPLQGCRGSC